MSIPTLRELRTEYDRAIAHTADLADGLTDEQIAWRPHADASSIGWHLGHQAAVAHFMIRNLTAAEPSPDADLDQLMDSATPEPDRVIPEVARILDYRGAVAERVHHIIGRIDDGDVGAPAQLRVIGATLMVAVINHEYQHSKWIGEVRVDQHGADLPPDPVSPCLSTIDGYVVIDPS